MRKLKLLLVLCMVAIAASAADFTDGGKYYLKNTASGKYWGAGSGWGTQATLVEHPEYVWLHLQNDGIYTIESQVSNGGSNKYFGGDYMDSDNAYWLTFTKNTDGKYTIAAGTNYYGYDGATTVLGKNLDATSQNVLWEVYSEAEMRTLLEAATVNAPVDATWLMLDPNFGRNNRWSGNLSTNANNESLQHADLGAAWTFDASNKNIGGDPTNCCVESYHAVFTMLQTLSSVPNGTYKLTAQGFYRQDGSDNDHLPYFYANDEKQSFPLKTGIENSMTDASNSFKTGAYTIEPIWVYVTDGTLAVGAKNETNTSLWCIWDNFVLTYYGNVTVAEAKLAAFVSAYNEALAAAQAYVSVDMFDDAKTALNDAISANTLDLTDASLTEGQLTTATANLNAAAEAAATAALKYDTYKNANTLINGGTNVDLTSLIVNPSFEQSTNGWTVVGGLGPQSNDSFGKKGTYYLEYWQPNGTKSVTQTVGYLPAGLYKMSVDVKARGVTSAKVFAGGIDQAVTIADAQNTYTVNFALDEKTDALIGFEGVGTGASSSWFALDNFQLTFVGTLPDDMPAVTGKMNASVAAAQTAALDAYVASKTVANYNAASAAIAAAQTSVDAYAAAAAAISKAESIIAETNVFVAAQKTTYQNAIDAAKSAYNEGTMTDEDAAALENTLNGGTNYKPNAPMRDFYAGAWTATNEVSIYTNNWSTEGNNDGSNFTTPFIEDWVSDASSLANTTISTSIAGLSTGTYKVTAKVRMRLNNNGTAPVGGVSLKASNGEAVSISGALNYDKFYVTDVEATGYVVNDGDALDINFIVNGTNASWLSIKAVNYERTGDVELAAASDYESLNEAINAHVLGFEAGEYAPYNNIDGAKALAAAKAIDQSVENVKPAVTAATAALTGATWTANTGEVNAFGDPTFAKSGNDGAQLGWTTDHSAGLGGALHARAFVLNSGENNYDKLAAFGQGDGTRSAGYFRFDGTNSAKTTTYTYGSTAGYTMPLKAATYLMSAQLGGWGQVAKDVVLQIVNENNEVVGSQTVHTPSTGVNAGGSVVNVKFEFEAVAGNYKLLLKNGSTDADNAIVISNLELMKAPVYAVVGNASFFSGSWDTATTTDILTLNNGVYTKTFTNQSLDKQTIEYKAIKKGGTVTWYPDGDNKTLSIPVNGVYNITFTFDGNDVTAEAIQTAESFTISAAGWATAVTYNAVDFTGNEKIKAYLATVSGNQVTLTEATKVPAGTPLVLKGETAAVSVIESAEAVTNDLKGSNEHGWEITDSEYARASFYGLTVANNTAKFARLNKGSIAAGKAYLEITGSGARELNVIFADETTGINAVATETNVEGVYNMNGQRVNAPSKGLYIVNGKKVVIK